MYEDQVFHVPNNIYTYNDAKAVCKAYGSRLATYGEIENAYKRGAEWCGFGWSADQMALYPTQMETWKKLQKRKGHKHDCGRPGINGGFVAYKKAPFGVNCYGIKPKAEQSDLDMMNANKDKVLPKSRHQMQTDRKMEFWKENSDKLLTVNSFNRDSWSRF